MGGYGNCANREMNDMEHDKDCMCHLCLPGSTPPPNPPPAGDKVEPTPNPSQEGNKSRDYTRAVYQNLMAVVELLDKKAPLPVSQKQIQEELGLSKGVVYDICWNLCKRNWAEDMGGGMVRTKKVVGEKELLVGRMVVKCVKDIYGLDV